MIMENGRVRSWYKWVEENRQPATLRRPEKGGGSGIVYDLSKQFLRRPWFIHRMIEDEKSHLFQRSLQQLSEITHNWSRGLTDRHFVQLANCLFNDIPGTASSKLISNRAFIGASSLSTFLSNITGARNSLWRKCVLKFSSCRAWCATLLLRNYFPDNIKAGIVFTSKWKWDGCNERGVGGTDATELDGQSEFQHRNGRGE